MSSFKLLEFLGHLQIHTIDPELNIVTDREKVEIKSNLDLEKIFGKHIEEIKKKSKFNLWEFLRLKR